MGLNVAQCFDLTRNQESQMLLLLCFFTKLVFSKWKSLHFDNQQILNRIQRCTYDFEFLAQEITHFGVDYLISFELNDVLRLLNLKNNAHSRKQVISLIELLMVKTVKVEQPNKSFSQHIIISFKTLKKGHYRGFEVCIHPILMSQLFQQSLVFNDQFLTKFYNLNNFIDSIDTTKGMTISSYYSIIDMPKKKQVDKSFQMLQSMLFKTFFFVKTKNTYYLKELISSRSKKHKKTRFLFTLRIIHLMKLVQQHFYVIVGIQYNEKIYLPVPPEIWYDLCFHHSDKNLQNSEFFISHIYD